jgi:ribose/xylose/arabinose/galactoside ABC-type transport system permease subunit
MGIDVRRVKSGTFILMGVAAAFTGVIAVLVDNNFYSDTGQALLLPTIAAVFVGGTPPWGGAGTVAGGIVGAFTVSFIDTGLVGIGLNGYYTGLFYGLVITLSVLSLRLLGGRYDSS